MPLPIAQKLSLVTPSPVDVSTAGTPIEFKVVSPAEEGLANIEVNFVISGPSPKPEISADRKTWKASGTVAKTQANGEVLIWVRSGPSSGEFRLRAEIDDYEPPDHLIFVAMKAAPSITDVLFIPDAPRTTWQGEPFAAAPPILVTTVPPSKLEVGLLLAGPGTTLESQENSARFVTGTGHETVSSGNALPQIQAGKRVGEVTITPSAGGCTGKPMRWHILPVPDRLKNEWGSDTHHQSIRAAIRYGIVLPYRLSGHKMLGDSTGEPDSVVPIAQWAIQLTLENTTYAKFKNSAADGGDTMVLLTNASGIASIPAGALEIHSGARNHTVTIRAAWSRSPTISGSWVIPPSLPDRAFSIYFDA